MVELGAEKPTATCDENFCRKTSGKRDPPGEHTVAVIGLTKGPSCAKVKIIPPLAFSEQADVMNWNHYNIELIIKMIMIMLILIQYKYI